jgi:deoxyribodipyrimidine photo-lyase
LESTLETTSARINFFWFRRDLRLDDNAGLYQALRAGVPVVPVFVLDSDILQALPSRSDARVQFIMEELTRLKRQLQELGSDLLVRVGKPEVVWKALLEEFSQVGAVYANHDYEPQARIRDAGVQTLGESRGVAFLSFKDQVIFERDEIVTEARKPYTVYTPYKKKWLASLSQFYLQSYPTEKYFQNFYRPSKKEKMISWTELGFETVPMTYPSAEVPRPILRTYAETRDFPARPGGTTRLGIYLRFGTVSIRCLAREAQQTSAVWLSELIWREFFMQVLFHFPEVVGRSFRPRFDAIQWRNHPEEFAKWCRGQTGYPLVDAGMRELNTTGFMHNRVRMVTASFLSKHLLIHWLWGERYFAAKLLDYDLAANNGNWQWAAGTGCDAAPYFRVFNPTAQAARFDQDSEYIKKWVPEVGTADYPSPMVEHVFARDRALAAFRRALKESP